MDVTSKAMITDPERRARLVGEMIAAGISVSNAHLTIDAVFLANDEAVRAFYASLDRFKHSPGVYLQAFLIAPQLAAVEFEQRAGAAVDSIGEMSRTAGLKPMTLGGEKT